VSAKTLAKNSIILSEEKAQPRELYNVSEENHYLEKRRVRKEMKIKGRLKIMEHLKIFLKINFTFILFNQKKINTS
jgi:hypothetical protein